MKNRAAIASTTITTKIDCTTLEVVRSPTDCALPVTRKPSRQPMTAILLAGRTASAFTAQIGSMKSREEIDAIRTLGLDPMELLVLPRVLALLISLPLLSFLAMLAGIIGGAMVCIFALDITPAMFLSMLHADTELRHFLVGMAKAPVFAFLIAVIGCLEGFRVSGSAQSVGAHTTSSVVQSIFVVILIDAIAALFFMEMGW